MTIALLNLLNMGGSPGAQTFVWDGSAQDGDLATAANWAGGVAPQAGAVLVFNATSEAVTTNTGPTGFSAIYIGDGYTGAFTLENSETVSRMKINKRVGNVSLGGTSIGSLYISDTPAGSGNVVTLACSITNAYISQTRGTVRINDDVANLYLTPTPGASVKVSFGPDNDIGTFMIGNTRAYNGSYLEQCESASNNLWLFGTTRAEFIEEKSLLTSGFSQANVYAGARLHHKADFQFIELNIIGGEFITRRNPSAGFTITNGTQYGGKIDLEDVAEVTLTNPITYYGGLFMPPPNKTVTYT